MDRLEHRGVAPRRVDIGRGGESQPPLDRRAKVGQDVSEQVRGHHHVQRLGRHHHPRGQRIDVVMADLDLGELGRELVRHLVPEHHRVFLGVRLGGRGQPARAPHRLLKAETQDPLDPGAGKDRGLDGDLLGAALMDPPARAGIFALGVLADAQDVEVPLAQRALDARQQAVGADVGILGEALADRQQQAVQRHRIGHLGRPADRAQQDRVKAREDLEPILGHHPARLKVMRAGPGQQRRGKPPRRRRLGHAQGGLGHGDADPVARNDGDAMGAGRGGTRRLLGIGHRGLRPGLRFADHLTRPGARPQGPAPRPRTLRTPPARLDRAQESHRLSRRLRNPVAVRPAGR